MKKLWIVFTLAIFLAPAMLFSQHEAPVRAITIPHVSTTHSGTVWETIELDGRDSENSWGAEETLTEYWTPAPPIPLPTSDLGGFIKVCYDLDNIYLFARVTDDTACIWNGTGDVKTFDNIEVFFDLDTSINLVGGLGSYYQNDSVIDAAQFRWNRGIDTTTGDSARNGTSLNDFGQTDDGTVWTLEVKIPFLSWMPKDLIIGLNICDRITLGFDVSFSDSDADDVSGFRSGQMAWDADVVGSGGTEDNAWHDTRVFGICHFENAVLCAGIKTNFSNNISLISLFPNPVSKTMNIDLTNFDFSSSYTVKLIHVNGQILINKTYSEKNIQVDLTEVVTKGLYLVQITSDNGTTENHKLIIE